MTPRQNVAFGSHLVRPPATVLRFENYVHGSREHEWHHRNKTLERFERHVARHLLGNARKAKPPPAPALSVMTPGTEYAGVPFFLRGTYVGTAPSGLQFSVDGGALIGGQGTVIGSSGTWSTTLTISTIASHVVKVQESNATTISATTGTFSVIAQPQPLPTPAGSYQTLDQVYADTGITDPRILFPMDGNDYYGDCEVAECAHGATLLDAKAGKLTIDAAADVLANYWRLTGGVDSGLANLTVLNDWKSGARYGVPAIKGYLSINPANTAHVMLGIEMFGYVHTSFSEASDTVNRFWAGEPWVPESRTPAGHAVPLVGYSGPPSTADDAMLSLITWGCQGPAPAPYPGVQKATWGWLQQAGTSYCYGILGSEVDLSGFDAQFDSALLNADFADLAN